MSTLGKIAREIAERGGGSEEHPSREELQRYLADIEAEANRGIRVHMSGCENCRTQCYMMDRQLDHD